MSALLILYSFFHWGLGRLPLGPILGHATPLGRGTTDTAFSPLTPAPRDGRPNSISIFVAATSISRSMTRRFGPLAPLTMGPTLSC